MPNDSRSIGDRLREMDEHARGSANTPENEPGNKEPAKGSRETGMGGTSNRERGREANVPPRGAGKERGHA